mmetsp:Transcript_29343/g.33515  ORF Transcript_29343/g.33515 Transcript_29343/m.33515 type:complete len:108 (-) Transcript_29343:469-792(-)
MNLFVHHWFFVSIPPKRTQSSRFLYATSYKEVLNSLHHPLLELQRNQAFTGDVCHSLELYFTIFTILVTFLSLKAVPNLLTRLTFGTLNSKKVSVYSCVSAKVSLSN